MTKLIELLEIAKNSLLYRQQKVVMIKATILGNKNSKLKKEIERQLWFWEKEAEESEACIRGLEIMIAQQKEAD